VVLQRERVTERKRGRDIEDKFGTETDAEEKAV
jgi:hypothetical protein